jgi:SpoVK/Ycf46/Vps4 family AAA+-type ATPase
MSLPGKHVAFFVCKGSDLLSKWVGESDRNIRKLFEKAVHTDDTGNDVVIVDEFVDEDVLVYDK